MDSQNQQTISWNNTDEEDVYRGAAVDSLHQNEHLSFAPQSFGNKGAAALSGNALDIYDPAEGPSFPTQSKQQHPLIEVVPTEQPLQSQVRSGDGDAAPFYDAFQPFYAHHSSTVNPLEMVDKVATILGVLCAAGTIDYHQKSTFVFGGRAFGKYQDCEFQVSVFSDRSSESVLELRRTSGEPFEFADIESNLLRRLTAAGALPQDGDVEMNADDDSEAMDTATSFGLALPALPPLDSMELDSAFDASDADEFKSMPTAMSREGAARILDDAVNLSATRDELRADIAILHGEATRNEDAFREIPDAASKIIGCCFHLNDCWAIKMYLVIVSKLISCGADTPQTLRQSVERVKAKWSATVINEVAPGVRFEFYPSQQIVSQCDQILEQLQ